MAAYLELARGFEHALVLAGIRRGPRQETWICCERCRAWTATLRLHHGVWTCAACVPWSRLAGDVGRYVFAIRIGLRGALLKARRTAVARSLVYYTQRSQHPAWGSLVDVAAARVVLEKSMPPRVPSSFGRGGSAFPWRRLSYTSGPWRKHMGIRVYVAICEGLHPAAVKAGLLESAARPFLTRAP